MPRSKLSLDFEAIGNEILRVPWMVDHLRSRAERIMEDAQGRAPVYSGPGRDEHRGRYKDSFKIETTSHGGDRHDRGEARVTNTAPEAIFVEKGRREFTQTVRGRDGKEHTVTIPAMEGQHILGSAMMAAAGDE